MFLGLTTREPSGVRMDAGTPGCCATGSAIYAEGCFKISASACIRFASAAFFADELP
jgi:hypothetical protein